MSAFEIYLLNISDNNDWEFTVHDNSQPFI